MLRNIIEIDETKCDGCGLCIPACEEGAIRLVAGKARVVSDAYCDGLGACLGHCPRGAISIVQRAAAPFDHAAVVDHLAASKRDSRSQHGPAPRQCPGTTSMQLQVIAPAPAVPCSGAAELPADASPHHISQLANWPVQLHLVSPSAPYLRGADLLLVADCVPLAVRTSMPGFLAVVRSPSAAPSSTTLRPTSRNCPRSFKSPNSTASRWFTWKYPAARACCALLKRRYSMWVRQFPCTMWW